MFIIRKDNTNIDYETHKSNQSDIINIDSNPSIVNFITEPLKLDVCYYTVVIL